MRYIGSAFAIVMLIHGGCTESDEAGAVVDAGPAVDAVVGTGFVDIGGTRYVFSSFKVEMMAERYLVTGVSGACTPGDLSCVQPSVIFDSFGQQTCDILMPNNPGVVLGYQGHLYVFAMTGNCSFLASRGEGQMSVESFVGDLIGADRNVAITSGEIHVITNL
jgi:hypothetical protein